MRIGITSVIVARICAVSEEDQGSLLSRRSLQKSWFEEDDSWVLVYNRHICVNVLVIHVSAPSTVNVKEELLQCCIALLTGNTSEV